MPAGHAEALLDPDSLAFAGATIRQLLSLRGVIDHVLEAFPHGGGLPYEASSDCLPSGLAARPSAATGTVMRPDTLRGYASAAGFSRFDVLPIEHDAFRLHLLRP